MGRNGGEGVIKTEWGDGEGRGKMEWGDGLRLSLVFAIAVCALCRPIFALLLPPFPSPCFLAHIL